MGKTINDPSIIALVQNQIHDYLMSDTYQVYYSEATGFTDYGTPITQEIIQTWRGVVDIPCRLQEYKLYKDTSISSGQDVLTNAHELIFPIDAPMKVGARVVINEIDYEVVTITNPTFLLGAKNATLVHLER